MGLFNWIPSCIGLQFKERGKEPPVSWFSHQGRCRQHTRMNVQTSTHQTVWIQNLCVGTHWANVSKTMKPHGLVCRHLFYIIPTVAANEVCHNRLFCDNIENRVSPITIYKEKYNVHWTMGDLVVRYCTSRIRVVCARKSIVLIVAFIVCKYVQLIVHK